MPVEVVGLKEAQRAMRALQPELSKELNKEIKSLLNPIVNTAKSYVPQEIDNLSGWMYQGKTNKITAGSSMFRVGKFPKYNPAQIKAGIKAQLQPTKRNRNGFTSLVRIVNQDRAGAIYETAGRVNPNGQPWNRQGATGKFSHSLNPNAGQQFIKAMVGEMKGDGRKRGRLIYRAWNENQGRALAAVMKAIENTANRTVAYIDAAKAFRKAA